MRNVCRSVMSLVVVCALATLILACGTSHKLLFLGVTPTIATFSAPGQTVQFTATATIVQVSESTKTPTTQDWTNRVTWTSSNTAVATINAAGLATGVGPGTTTIIASTGKFSATGTLSMSASLPTLTIQEVGLSSGTVTSVPPGINCSSTNSSSAGCTGTFLPGTAVQLTAAGPPGTFGGWSANCTPTTSATCTITVNDSQSVSVIFN